ncbi:MAG: hypothetical protein RR880_02940, partial [Bacteroidales bacterium]
ILSLEQAIDDKIANSTIVIFAEIFIVYIFKLLLFQLLNLRIIILLAKYILFIYRLLSIKNKRLAKFYKESGES